MSLYLGENLISGQATLVGESRNIGQIIPSTIPLTDAGLHLLDGALIQGSGIYSAFVDYIAGLDLTASYFCTEQEWQASIAQYGVCGKFVYDSVNNTVRLPKYSNKIYTQELDTTAPVVGNGMTLGLTNGTQNYGLSGWGGDSFTQVVTSIYGQPVGITGSGPVNRSVSLGVTSDPTKSGLIAQLSDITTSLDGYYYIVVATSTKTDIQVDIDEVVTDLNGKADVDLSNINASQSAKNEIVSWGMPDYSAGISKARNINYSETTNGYLIVDYTSDTNSELEITINGTSFRFHQGFYGTDYNHCNVGVVPIPKNIQYRITYLEGCRVRYFPCIGG